MNLVQLIKKGANKNNEKVASEPNPYLKIGENQLINIRVLIWSYIKTLKVHNHIYKL